VKIPSPRRAKETGVFCDEMPLGLPEEGVTNISKRFKKWENPKEERRTTIKEFPEERKTKQPENIQNAFHVPEERKRESAKRNREGGKHRADIARGNLRNAVRGKRRPVTKKKLARQLVAGSKEREGSFPSYGRHALPEKPGLSRKKTPGGEERGHGGDDQLRETREERGRKGRPLNGKGAG